MPDDVIDALRRGDTATALSAATAAAQANPASADALYALAMAQRAAGDHAAARLAIGNAIAIDPERGDLHMVMASLAIDERDLDAARHSASTAVKADPNHLPGYVALAHLALAEGSPDEAERLVKFAELVAADHPQTLLARGNLAQARGNTDLALRLLTQAAQALPDDAAVLSSLALVYLGSGQLAFAEQALRKALTAQPDARRLRWMLFSVLRRQARSEDALAELATLAQHPRDPWVLVQRGALMLELGRLDEAVADYRDLLIATSVSPRLLEAVVTSFRGHRRTGAALVLLEELLSADAASDILWHYRVALEGETGGAPGVQVDRWLAAMPDSLDAWSVEALRREASGELDAAEAAADRVLVQDGERIQIQGIKMRAELRADPAVAIHRLDRMLAAEDNPPSRRSLLMWKGYAADRMGRFDVAVEAWTRLIREPVAAPSPPAAPGDTRCIPAPLQDVGEAPPLLLWGLPGSRIERVVQQLRESDARIVVDDRFGPRPRPDGFNIGRDDLGPVDGDHESWRAGIADYRLEPARVADLLPHWDIRIEAGLPSARLIAVIRDPRDLLLNWWVFGCPQNYAFPGVHAAAEWLAAALEPLAGRMTEKADQTLVLRLDEDASEPDAALAAFIQAPVEALSGVGAPRNRLGGHDGMFPAGHWRHYRTELDAPFRQLESLAGRLGY